MNQLSVGDLRDILADYADEATVFISRYGLTEPARKVEPSSQRWSVIIGDDRTAS